MKKYILTRTFFKTSCLLILVSSVLLTGCATALYNAAYKGETDIVKDLLDKGADVNEKMARDITALMPASQEGRVDTVKLLLDRGADVNLAFGSSRLTALSLAALNGHSDVAKLLIERGADINKAIVGLLNFKEKGGDRTGGAVELLNEFKREKASSRPTVVKQPAITASVSIVIKSDVDELPTIKTKPNKNSYAIVIGIEQYRQKLPKADYAVSDAKLVREYLSKVMGYQEENIVTLTNENASKGDLEKYLDQWLKNVVEKDGTVFVYYSGHGAPNVVTGDAYLVPYDGDPAFIEQTGYSLKRLYENLSKLPAKNVIVALDSCFSGAGGKSVSAKGSRALVRVEKALALNIAVLTASLDNQISSSYEDKGHGVFTYFLLKGIKEMLAEDKNSKLALSELYNYIKPQVERTSRRLFNNEQTPQLITANEQMKNIGLR